MVAKEIDISLEKWTKKILSGDEILVKKTIDELRDQGNSKVIPVLGTLLQNSPSEEVTISVISLLRDLKNQDSVPALVGIVKNSKDLEIFHQLISTAWENGLDYSEHLEFFISVVLEEPLISAIEAFTVLEENVEKLNPQKRNFLSKELSEKSKSLSKEKSKLIHELQSILSIASGPFSLDKN